MMKNCNCGGPVRKVRRYEDGGFVDFLSGDAAEYIPPDDWGLIDQGDATEYIPPDDWGLIDQGTTDVSALIGGDVVNDPVSADVQTLLAYLSGTQGHEQPPLETVDIEQRPDVMTVDVRGSQQGQSPLERAGAAIRSAFSVSQQPEGTSGGISSTPITNTNSSLVMLPNGQYAIVQSKPETFSWQNLLKLGLGGLGAVGSFKAAKDARDRAEKYDDERRALVEQKNAAYQSALGRLNLPGGYAALSPAATSFRRPT